MRLIKNRDGVYEYVLTKSIMLIFIMALVYLFYSFYMQLIVETGWKVANLKAEEIAKRMDEVINNDNVEITNTIFLEENLRAGWNIFRYNLTITPGVVEIRLIDYPYQDVRGIGVFGMGRLEGTGGESYVACSWKDVSGGIATITVKKTHYYEFYPSTSNERCAGELPGPEGTTCYHIEVELGASESCGEYMKMGGEWKER